LSILCDNLDRLDKLYTISSLSRDGSAAGDLSWGLGAGRRPYHPGRHTRAQGHKEFGQASRAWTEDYGWIRCGRPRDTVWSRCSFPFALATTRSADRHFRIVAVHGLGARPEYTWTVKGDVVDESASVDGDASDADWKPKLKKGRVDWLSDSRFLRTDFPGAIVMRFAHNADWLFRGPWTTAQKTGTDLLKHLNDERQAFDGHLPPVLFIGHSFGGIVVKEAIVRAKVDKKYQEILEATCGIVFLGTPHQGAALSTPASWLAGLLSLFGSKTMLLKSLQSHDERLNNLQDSFISVISDLPDPLKDHVWSFYETQDTYYLKVVSGGRVCASQRSQPVSSSITVAHSV
jgi:hypothetical protein